MSVDPALFSQSVQLASAFIVNGDIRLGGSTRPDSTAMAMLEDLIPTLYDSLRSAQTRIASRD